MKLIILFLPHQEHSFFCLKDVFFLISKDLMHSDIQQLLIPRQSPRIPMLLNTETVFQQQHVLALFWPANQSQSIWNVH